MPVASLAAALKLPPGPWSASILSFAKFFSLPLDGDFLAAIRQRVLKAETLGKGGAPESGMAESGAAESGTVGGGGAEELREALSLAALAASAKGVELPPEALAEYGRALRGRKQEGDSQPEPEAESDSGQDSGPNFGTGSGPEPGAESGPEFGTEGSGGDHGGNRGEGRDRKDAPAGPVLGEKLLAAQGPLLRLLNELPGREGERWVVLPFSTEDGFEGCLRILLRPRTGPESRSEPRSTAYRVERLGLDIRRRGQTGLEETGPDDPGPETAWSFILRGADTAGAADTAGMAGAAGMADTAGMADAAGKVEPGGGPLLEVFCRPAPGPTKALERELAALLELPPDSVRVREEAAFAEDSRDRTIPLLH